MVTKLYLFALFLVLLTAIIVGILAAHSVLCPHIPPVFAPGHYI